MTAKEKMLDIIEKYGVNSVEEFLFTYIDVYHKEFSASRINDLVASLSSYNNGLIEALEITKSVASERAYYLKTYLEGKMYTTKEAAIKHLPVQIKNAEAIIEACKNLYSTEDWNM